MESFKNLYKKHKLWQLMIILVLHIVAMSVIVVMLYNDILTRADRGLRHSVMIVCSVVTLLNITAVVLIYVGNIRFAKKNIFRIAELEDINEQQNKKLKDYIEQLRQEINQNELLGHEIIDKNELITTYESILINSNSKIVSLGKKLGESFDIIEAAREHAEVYDKLKAAFLANVSHELRTPINGINGFADLLCKNIPQDKRKEYTVKMISSTNNFVALVNEVVNYSHIQSGNMVFNAITFNINRLIRLVKSQTLKQMAELKKEVMLNFPPNLDEEFYVCLSEKGVSLILENLMSNAIKFTHKGSITLTCMVIGNKLEISVSDTGIGIPIDKQQIIFQSFVQNETILSRRYGGLGLGLSICKAVVGMMGGAITLDSQPGQGSKFSVSLPIMQNNASDISLYERINKHLKISMTEKKVLLIESNQVDRESLTEFFNDWQIPVLTCDIGDDEYSIAQRHCQEIGLVVMEINSPEEVSVQLAQKILNVCPFSGFIFTMSQNISKSAMEKIGAISAEILQKPFNSNDLANVINRYLITQNT